MELLIPGLILVALMAYASTRIKRVAAEAFEPETVETDDFTLEKPAGFLNVINRDTSLAFQAYSKEMGSGEASEFRAARAEARIYENRTLDYAVNAIKETTAVTTDTAEIIAERKYRVLEAESTENGIGFQEMYKLAEKDRRVVEFKIISVAGIDAELARNIDLLFNSFVMK
jgi:hypothetical protein